MESISRIGRRRTIFRIFLKILLPLIPAIVGIWLSSLYITPTRPTDDGAQYFAMAYNMAKFGVSSVSEVDSPEVRPDYLREPGAAFLYSLAMRATVGIDHHRLSCFLSPEMPCRDLVMKIAKLNIVLFVFIILAAYLGTLRLLGSYAAAFLAALILASNTILPSYARIFTSEMPGALFFLCHSILLYLAFAERRRWTFAMGAGVFLGALILTKAIYLYWMLFLWLAFAAVVLVRRQRVKKEFLAAALSVLIPATAIVGPWVARNYHHFDHLAVSDPDRGNSVLILRADFTTISWTQYLAGYLYFTPYVGPDLANRIFGATAGDAFEFSGVTAIESPQHTDNIVIRRLGAGERTSEIVARESLMVMLENWDKQIALIPLTIYRGMFIGGCCDVLQNNVPIYWVANPPPNVEISLQILRAIHIAITLALGPILFFFAVYSGFARNWKLLLLCGPALFHFAIHGVLTNFNSRFSFPLFPTLVVIFVFSLMLLSAKRRAVLLKPEGNRFSA